MDTKNRTISMGFKEPSRWCGTMRDARPHSRIALEQGNHGIAVGFFDIRFHGIGLDGRNKRLRFF